MPTQISGSIPQSASDNELRSNDVLISELSDDPEMASLVIKFLGKLDQKTTEMSQCLSTNRWEDLARLAHQLKGAGGSYGYPSISEAAQRLEKLAKSQSDFEGTQRAVEDVRDLCQRAIRGNAQQERCLTDTQLLEQKS